MWLAEFEVNWYHVPDYPFGGANTIGTVSTIGCLNN